MTCVGLYNLVIAADRRRGGRLHAFANAMAQKPSGFIWQPKHAAQLQCAHALLACSHQVSGKQPFVQWDMRSLKNCAGAARELVPDNRCIGTFRLVYYQPSYGH